MTVVTGDGAGSKAPSGMDCPVPGEGGMHPKAGSGPAFWIGTVVGWSVVAYGIYGIFHNHIDTRPTLKARELGRFFAGLLVGHDVLVVPLALLVGVAVNRLVPGRVRSFVQAAMIVSATLVLFAYPAVRGFGRHVDPANHTLVPRNYAHGLLLSIALVWAAALVLAAVRLLRQRRHRRRSAPDG